jgi:hypothetical protein
MRMPPHTCSFSMHGLHQTCAAYPSPPAPRVEEASHLSEFGHRTCFVDITKTSHPTLRRKPELGNQGTTLCPFENFVHYAPYFHPSPLRSSPKRQPLKTRSTLVTPLG